MEACPSNMFVQPTASDWTMYPFSSQNEKDFRNLLSVYLDCVFFPQLREIDFKQEAWRLEHEDPSDRSSPIVFKGVVYNEMKGHFVRDRIEALWIDIDVLTLWAVSPKGKLPEHICSGTSK